VSARDLDASAWPAPTHAQRRRQRAAIAQRLVPKAPEAMAALDWDTLARAPAWLALPPAALASFECQVGAVLCARALQLWIDGARLAAARAALGEGFLAALLALPEEASISPALVACPQIDVAAHVVPLLQASGSSVLLASLPHGALRHAACAALAPAQPSTMAPELAQTLVARAQALAAYGPATAAGAEAVSGSAA
jgi:hypothetical protein